MLILCDSIAKYVTVRHAQVVPFPGKTVGYVLDQIAFNQLSVKNVPAILLHLGTNDIGNKLSGRRDISLFELEALYRSLISAIRVRNSTCYLLIAGILPRYVDHATSWPLIYGINFAVQSICCSKLRTIYVPAEKFMFRDKAFSDLRTECFDYRGRLHLNGAGIERLNQCFSQALSPVNLARELHWKRVPRQGQGPYIMS